MDRQIEAGTLNLTAEKKALASISEAKRLRRTVEGFQTEQTAIDADKARADDFRKKLVSPIPSYAMILRKPITAQ